MSLSLRHNTVDGLSIRRLLGRDDWKVPVPFGESGWIIDGRGPAGRVIVTDGPAPEDPTIWRHASISHPDRLPTYEDLVRLHQAVWPDGWAYQVFAPPAAHVNIHAYALHLWGRPDGRMLLPNFGANRSI